MSREVEAGDTAPAALILRVTPHTPITRIKCLSQGCVDTSRRGEPPVMPALLGAQFQDTALLGRS